MDDFDLNPPDADEAALVTYALATAVSTDAGLTPLQHTLLVALIEAMTGHAVDPTNGPHVDDAELATGLRRRNAAYRSRIVQLMVMLELVLHPLPIEVAERVRRYAAALGVDDEMIAVAEEFATGALDLAAADFARNGYLASLDPSRLSAVHAQALDSPWGVMSADDSLAAQWLSLDSLPVGTLGRGVADFYADRGFVQPGLPGSAPPLLAQHDWVHVVAGYGTTLENELEVFAFMARANDDPRGFSLLAMIVSLFETGYLAAGAGLFEADPGHLTTSGMSARIADAMRRGALMTGSHDFLATDWFEIADRPISVIRKEWSIPDKRTELGSPGPWDAGGITAYQLKAAAARSELLGRDHRAWQPDPLRS